MGGRLGGIGVLQPGRIARPALAVTNIGRIGQIRRIRRVGKPQFPNGFGFGVVFAPGAELAVAQEILVVEEQFVEAGPGHLDQAQFGLAGGRRRAAAFGDVLASAARGLHHLVGRARARVHKARAELHRGVVNHRRHLETAQLAVAPAGAQAPGFGGIRRICPIRPIGRIRRMVCGRTAHAPGASAIR